MRFVIPNDNESSRILRGYLRHAGLSVIDRKQIIGAHYTIRLDEVPSGDACFDSIDCDLENELVSAVRKVAIVRLVTQGGNVHSDQEVAIMVPDDAREKVVLAIYTGILRHLKAPAKTFWQRVFGTVLMLCLCAAAGMAQSTPGAGATQKVDITKVGGTAVGGTSVPVTCTSGCSGGGAATIANGADVNSGATTDPAVSGDVNGTLSAKVRQLNKIFTLVWDSVNNRIHVNIDNSTLAVTQSGSWTITSITNPVSVTGTFWQAVQPVSGTFWQATQPVSLASVPLPTGASTEATLALIKAKTDNIDVALSTRTKPADQQHVIVDSSATVTVTGPLTDVQLRASAVPVTANAGTNLNTSALALESGGNLATIASKDFATAAKQDTGNTSLSTIAGKDFATSAKQDLGNTSLASLDAKSPALTNGSEPVTVINLPPMPPLLTQQQLANPLLYRAAIKAYCARVLCPALPLGK